MKFIPVTEKNSEEMAQRLVCILMGQSITISSFYYDASKKVETPKIIGERLLAYETADGYTFVNGRMRIPLVPSRSILWDLKEGEVRLSFEDSGIILERHLPHGKIVFRVIASV